MLQQAHLILASGVLLGCHFGTWVLCIENTSLPHALLVSVSAPIIIAVGAWLLRKPISVGKHSDPLSAFRASAFGLYCIAYSTC